MIKLAMFIGIILILTTLAGKSLYDIAHNEEYWERREQAKILSK